MTRKFSNHPHATDGTLNSCFDHIGSYQQCMPYSLPLEIEPATQNVETELLPMGHQFMPNKSTSHGKNAQLQDHMYLESTFLP